MPSDKNIFSAKVKNVLSTKVKNKNILKSLQQKVADAKAVIFTDYAGLDANNINNLRENMKTNDAEVVIAKNTLLKLALKDHKAEKAEKAEMVVEVDLKGTVATIFAYKDSISTIKALFEFIKKAELPKVKSGFVDGMYNTGEQIELISELPSKQELLSKLVYTLISPINRLVRSLNSPQQKLVRTISAIAEQTKGGAN